MTDHLEVSREIAASPEVVYAAISDVTRMGEWSPECHTCEWHDGFSAPEVGAVFDGHNRSADGTKEWTTQGKITVAEPGKRFEFHALAMDFHFATWCYEIEPTANGCKVTEKWDDLRPDAIKAMGEEISGVADRGEFNRRNMEQTLERLAAAVEG